MVNPFKEVNWNPARPERRKFAVSLMIGFLCFVLVLLLGRRLFSDAWHLEPSFWLGGCGFTFGLIFWLAPGISKPFYLAWYFLACCIGIVVSNVLLIGFFFAVVTPIGLLLRAFGKAPLRKTADKNMVTYWQEAERVTDVKRYYRQF